MIPQSPITSGNDETFDVITGQPHCIASKTGSPKPSYNDGYTKHSALE